MAKKRGEDSDEEQQEPENNKTEEVQAESSDDDEDMEEGEGGFVKEKADETPKKTKKSKEAAAETETAEKSGEHASNVDKKRKAAKPHRALVLMPKKRHKTDEKLGKEPQKGRLTRAKTAKTPAKRPHRFRSGTRALMEIKFYQKSTGLLAQRAPFQRMIREIGDSVKSELRWQEDALIAVQELGEGFLTMLFEKLQILACADNNRQEVQLDDLKTLRLLEKVENPGSATLQKTAAKA